MSRKQLLIILALAISVCCVGVVLIGLLLPESEATPEPASMPTAASSVQPMNELPPPTAVLTDTPMPTDTPIPTRIPTPVPTDTPPSISPEVQQYLLSLLAHLQTMADALNAISDLASSPDFLSDDWKIRIATQLAIIQMTHETLTEMDVPPEMTGIHKSILNATSDCELATHFLADGIDNLDVDSLETATSLMQSCGEKIKEPSRMLEEYID